MQTEFDDCQVNALHRMWDRYQQVFLTADDLKAHPKARKDPNMFPMVALFAAKKRLEGDKKKGAPSGKPTMAEGFSRIVKVPFIRRPATGTRKALILDYDGTLRRDAKEVGGEFHYPVTIDQVQALPNRGRVLKDYLDRGYLLLGVTTQSGVANGHLTEETAQRLITETGRQVGYQLGGDTPFVIPTLVCVHGSFPVSCYCRKPQAGLGVWLTRQYNLWPSDCLYVGDLGTDRSFAERCGFQFAEADQFFKG
jgi:HAD superfamily hydrolase (TIGR01662 family)